MYCIFSLVCNTGNITVPEETLVKLSIVIVLLVRIASLRKREYNLLSQYSYLLVCYSKSPYKSL